MTSLYHAAAAPAPAPVAPAAPAAEAAEAAAEAAGVNHPQTIDSNSDSKLSGTPVMWAAKKPSAMSSFRQWVKLKHPQALPLQDECSFAAMHAWSVDKISDFWACVWEFCDVKASRKWEAIVDESIPMDMIPEWFVGARLNYAENLLWVFFFFIFSFFL